MALSSALASLKQRGATVVMIGHGPSMMARTDKLVVLRDGHLETFAPSPEVRAKYAPPLRPVDPPARVDAV